MKYVLYDILLHILLIVLSPYFILKMITVRKYAPGLTERFGFIDARKLKALDGGPVLWAHAVSVGETKAVLPLLKSLKRQRPEVRILFSTVTKTGQHIAEKEGLGVIDSLIYFPLDISWVVARVIRRIDPKAFIVVEKEVWPNFFNRLKRVNVPIMAINGTLSEKSFKRYLLFKSFFSSVFAMIDLYAAQTKADRTRAIRAGVRETRAVVTGNIKFDLEPPEIDSAAFNALRSAIGVGGGDKIIVAGSTHPGEEAILLDAYKALGAENRAIKLIIAPRHPERFNAVETIIKESGFSYTRRSAYKDMAGAEHGAAINPSVVLLDTLGELMTVYSLSDIAIVGGSLVDGIGGHNLMEPAYFGKPVLYGKHLSTYLHMADMLEAAGGGVRVSSVTDLTARLKELLANDLLRAKTGASARQVVEENRGAIERTLKGITRLLNEQAR
jgi:3-deoxy-D-manno-octulosonic-acid transferase